ncbi:ATP-binding protein [Sinosporangium siamense]|nr:ATP-binding protein [Sinosporangium siamense]
MVRMIAFVRAGTAGFVYVPLISWNRLDRPWLALALAIAATVHSAWFVWWALRVKTPDDPVLVWTDVAVAIVFMLVGSRAAPEFARNLLMTPLVPYSLVTSAVLGFGLRWGRAPAFAVLGLMVTWVVSLLPDIGQKLGSDLLGFVMWYVIGALIGREMLNLAHRADDASARAEESQRLLAQRAIHDDLLPVIERVAQGGDLGEPLSKAARRAAFLGRAYLGDRRKGGVPAFEGRISDIVDNAVNLGSLVEHELRVAADPPPRIAEACAAAVAEALNNVRRHAGEGVIARLYVESGPDWVLATVWDDGRGFDPKKVAPGLGFTGAYAAVRALGGECTIAAYPGEGTKVTVHWEAAEDGEAGADA